MGPQHPDSDMEQAHRPHHHHTSTTTSTNGRTQNVMPPRRLRRQSAAITCPDGRGLHPRIPHDKNIALRKDAPSREIDTLEAPPSCPPTPVKAFARLHHACRPLAHVVAASTPPLRTTTTPPGEALRTLSTTTAPERTSASPPTPPPR
jgi:hypothetical protein